jgi:NAD(P)-dependent dehydrogenase (short-subunit alcohol dehydrogenase family)
VSNIEDLQNAVQEAVGSYGSLDVMVNNAGISQRISDFMEKLKTTLRR